MFKALGLFSIIPFSVLLAVSFFILFVLRKETTGALRVFGYIIAALLWLGALLVFSAGLYTVYSGKPMACPMQQMMRGQSMFGTHKMPAMMRGQKQMMRGNLSEMAPEKTEKVPTE